jgi:hypothetical protein
MEWRRAVLSLTSVAALACAAALLLQRHAGDPAADVARGAEDAFARGLHPRELPPGQPALRWTGPRAQFEFRGLPLGPATLEVAVHGNPAPVTVAVDGVVIDTIAPGGPGVTLRVPVRDGRLRVETATAGFFAGGRQLGALLDRVVVRPESRRTTPWVLLVLVLPALCLAAAALAARASPLVASAAGVLGIGACAALLGPAGLLHSPYAGRLGGTIAVVALLAALLALAVQRRFPGAAGAAFLSFLAACLVQGLAATSPAMVVSDAVFHANKLAAVAGGDWFPTSVTQHARPFRFPYGVSFYAALVPLRRAGGDGVALVRAAAALSGVAASFALFLLLVRAGPWRAACAVFLLQLQPALFEPFSYGNLSNVFGQSATVLFFCWWCARAPGGAIAGALLLALAALAHFSSAVVLAVLCVALVALDRAVLRDRTRMLALAAGGLLVAAYYAHFVPLVLAQAPRLLEGGGPGAGPRPGLLATLVVQAARAAWGWGVPALALAIVGLRALPPERVARGVLAFLAAGGVLFLAAAVSPLDVRWVYALTLPVAIAAASGAAQLWAAGGGGRAAATALLAVQAALGLHGVWIALWFRYR